MSNLLDTVSPLARNYHLNSREKFEKLLSVVSFVSFDLFDTLVWREKLFSPKDLFYQVEEIAKNELGITFRNFNALRVRAEEIARVRAYGDNLEEITLEEIYQELSRLLKIDSEQANRILKIELELEKSRIKTLDAGKQLFDKAISAGKKVAIVSDIYFDENSIEDIVNQNGYSEAAKIYISSTYRKTKAEGSLYEIVIKDLGCLPNQLLHVGDNKHSDISMALKKGIRVCLATNARKHFKWRCGIGDVASGDLITSAMLCKISEMYYERQDTEIKDSVLKRTAIENLSLLYYGYAAWLLKKVKQGRYQRVYFAARDGWIVKRFFDLLADAANLTIDSRYIYVSRAALYPSLIFTEPETARKQFCQNWDLLTIEHALKRASLSFDECKDSLTKHDLAEPGLLLNHSTLPRFKAFLEDIWPLVESKNKERYELIVEYLRQEKFLESETVAFVDLGWHGSLQNCLMKLLKYLGIEKEINGYYLGTFAKPSKAEPNFTVEGYLLNDDRPHWISELVRYGPSVLELFHNANHGTVVGYKNQDEQILPILENNPVELEQFHQIIEPVQNAAFDFVSQQLKSLGITNIKAPEIALIARMALRVIYKPTIEEAKTFGSLKIACDFGEGAKMRSITGMLEYNLQDIQEEHLPDGTTPIWRPGFNTLKSSKVLPEYLLI